MDNTDVVSRIKEVIHQENLSVSAFAKKINFNQSNLSKILNGKRDIPFSLLDAIISNTNVDRNWLLAGKNDRTTSNAKPLSMNSIVSIPLISQYAYAGYLAGYSDPEYIENLPTIEFMPNRHMTGNYVAFEVRGDSMDDGTSDGYLNGEILICREVEQDYWRDSKLFINKRDFVIVHTDGILIKRIIKHDVENHIITIHSLNPLYPDKEIDLAEVKQIFSVVESRRQRRR